MDALLKVGLVLAINGKDFDIVEIEEKQNRYRGFLGIMGRMVRCM